MCIYPTVKRPVEFPAAPFNRVAHIGSVLCFVWSLWTLAKSELLCVCDWGQVAKLYRDASLGNAISIVVSRIIVLTEDQVSGIFAADVHLYYLPTASAAAAAVVIQ